MRYHTGSLDLKLGLAFGVRILLFSLSNLNFPIYFYLFFNTIHSFVPPANTVSAIVIVSHSWTALLLSSLREPSRPLR